MTAHLEPPSRAPHSTIPMLVWADIDEGIADMVRHLNTIPGVRTWASCQGTIGEGGPHPYRAQVAVSWPDDATFERLRSEFDVSDIGDQWCYVHPRIDRRPVIQKLVERTRIEELTAALTELLRLIRLAIRTGEGREGTGKSARKDCQRSTR
jgi:hypothetical protein